MGVKGVINRSVYLFFDMEMLKTVVSSGHKCIVFWAFLRQILINMNHRPAIDARLTV